LKCVKTCCPWQDVLWFCSRKAWRSISFLWNISGIGILQSSFNLFPKSTLPNCKIYNANFYWAILPSWLVCQIHFVTLWSSHRQVHVAKSTFPSWELHIAKSTFPSCQLHISPPSQVVNSIAKATVPNCEVHFPFVVCPNELQAAHKKSFFNRVFNAWLFFLGPSMEFGWLSLKIIVNELQFMSEIKV
jgi:hypothetical protein